ncbi:ABC transporter ATP-binding protein [Sulfuracidifex metallicus]|uniref:ATP-binding cassette domain-containing protein n=2 Tax=Sulfuracidifex metallicus TaxID=47303 RepID=A0A6A9QKS3_SULME|nr:ABC transporter ATP-binding protein [Sulfuracidifex metallicus]MUN29606.1 ATP-binding cassette domain-containing protein [Sulfuracidifex metallicus DSM 6482 = JCM 9184]WOE49882.1 ABC transporter ATP-binding protein [Sulfuracidifex metallicus DSM 6482 = JCM 9184]
MIELKELIKRYGQKVVLDGISEKIETGEFFVILGPSGAGKSTMLKVIAGIEELDKGQILVDGKDISHLPPEKRNIAMVFQNYALYPNMTVFDNIAFPLKMKGMKKEEIQEKVNRVAKLLGIGDILKNNVTKISGGQQQRVAIARAIVREPSFYLLDEPLSNLDARTRFVARGELKRIQKELGGTFIYVTHDQKEAMSLADRIAVLHLGKFEQVGTPMELYEYPKTKWVGDFIGDFLMNFLPGNVIGIDGVEIGFRPEWVKVDDGEFNGVVNSMESVGESTYLFLEVKDMKVVIAAKGSFDVGDEVKFGITKFRKYKNGFMVDER